MILVALFCATNIFAFDFIITDFYVRDKVGQEWTEWESGKSSMGGSFDNGILIIYSPVIQKYSIYRSGERYIDLDGNEVVGFNVIDQDNNKSIIKFIINHETLGIRIHIIYDNRQWMYDIIL